MPKSMIDEINRLVEKKESGAASADDLQRLSQLSKKAYWKISALITAGIVIVCAAVGAAGAVLFSKFAPVELAQLLPQVTWRTGAAAGGILSLVICARESVVSRSFYLKQTTKERVSAHL